MTRRQLGLAAAGIAAAQAQNPSTTAKSTYAGALAGFETKVDLASFDPVAWTLRRHDEAPLKLTFRATNRKQAEAWQRELRAKLIELLGGFPARGQLKPQTLEVREFPTHRREKFVFESRPGVGVLGYLLTPKNASGPVPVAVCIPGHGRGVDDIVGIDEQGRDRTERRSYQFDFGIQVAERGMAALAIEPMAFGCRRDEKTKAKGATSYACQPVAGSALLLGETMIGWRVYDVMRAIDWIETRPELDAKRVGCIGISGGGTCTLFSAALEPRIKAALVSGYINTFRACIMSMSHCMDNYVPGILNWAEMYDVAGLIAPRPLFCEGGDRDPIFPVEAAHQSFARVKKVYEVFGAGDATQQDTFSGVHEFHGVRGIPFVVEALKA
jgi:dienelactone hydrolase